VSELTRGCLQKEWCKTEQLKQVVREKGCRKRKIINRFCYGQCNSFFIPKSGHRDMQVGLREETLASICKTQSNWPVKYYTCMSKPWFRFVAVKDCVVGRYQTGPGLHEAISSRARADLSQAIRLARGFSRCRHHAVR